MSCTSPAAKTPTVQLYAVPNYDAARICEVVLDSLRRMNLQPRGEVLLKPNLVASGKYFPHAHTRAEFVEGVAAAVRTLAPTSTITVGERSGITIPTRFAFEGAGFNALAERSALRLAPFEEDRQERVEYTHSGRLRDHVYIPESVLRPQFFINCPKFKAHPWTTVTFSMKNYIGIQDDRHRLIDHDHALNDKVRDLQFVRQPELVAIDAIVAGEGRMLTPLPFHLGLVITGNDQLAVDSVCCHILGVDPESVAHLRGARLAGIGTMRLDDIALGGDVTLTEAQKKADGFRVGLIPVDKYFEDSNLRAYAGRTPGDEGYCWGGCPGALQEAIEIMRLFDATTDARLPRTHVVFGDYDGPMDVRPDERVILMGDCAALGPSKPEWASQYQDRSLVDPRRAPGADMLGKMAKMARFNAQLGAARFNVQLGAARLNGAEVIRLSGCPVSVAEQVLLLVKLGALKNPYLDPSQALPFASAYLSTKTRTAIKRVLGEPYLRA